MYIYTRFSQQNIHCRMKELYNATKKSLPFVIYQKKMLYSKFVITLLFKLIPFRIQNVF